MFSRILTALRERRERKRRALRHAIATYRGEVARATDQIRRAVPAFPEFATQVEQRAHAVVPRQKWLLL